MPPDASADRARTGPGSPMNSKARSGWSGARNRSTVTTRRPKRATAGSIVIRRPVGGDGVLERDVEQRLVPGHMPCPAGSGDCRKCARAVSKSAKLRSDGSETRSAVVAGASSASAVLVDIVSAGTIQRRAASRSTASSRAGSDTSRKTTPSRVGNVTSRIAASGTRTRTCRRWPFRPRRKSESSTSAGMSCAASRTSPGSAIGSIRSTMSAATMAAPARTGRRGRCILTAIRGDSMQRRSGMTIAASAAVAMSWIAWSTM